MGVSATEHGLRLKMPTTTVNPISPSKTQEGAIPAQGGGKLSVSQTLERITRVVAQELEVPYEQIMSRNRTQPVADARFLAMFLCCEQFPWMEQAKVAEYFKRHRTDVHHARRLVKDRCECDVRFGEIVRLIRRVIFGLPESAPSVPVC